MPALVLPDDAIPGLARKLDVPMIRALRRAGQGASVLNDRTIDQETADAFQRLSSLGCVDSALSGFASLRWAITSNGTRSLRYLDAQAAGDSAGRAV